MNAIELTAAPRLYIHKKGNQFCLINYSFSIILLHPTVQEHGIVCDCVLTHVLFSTFLTFLFPVFLNSHTIQLQSRFMNFWREGWKKGEVFCSMINTNRRSWKNKAQWENLWNEMQLQYNGQEKELRVIAEKSLKTLIRMRHSTSEEGLWVTLAVAAEPDEYKNSIYFFN